MTSRRTAARQLRRFLMSENKTGINRRQFLKRGGTLGLGALLGPSFVRSASAASKERVVVLLGVGLDSLHPYGYSGGGISGIWQHMIDRLVELDFSGKKYVGLLPTRGSSRGGNGFSTSRKESAFITALRSHRKTSFSHSTA